MLSSGALPAPPRAAVLRAAMPVAHAYRLPPCLRPWAPVMTGMLRLHVVWALGWPPEPLQWRACSGCIHDVWALVLPRGPLPCLRPCPRTYMASAALSAAPSPCNGGHARVTYMSSGLLSSPWAPAMAGMPSTCVRLGPFLPPASRRSACGHARGTYHAWRLSPCLGP